MRRKGPGSDIFLGPSDIHIQKKLRSDRESALEMAVEGGQICDGASASEFEFSTEDGSRTDFEFLCRIIDATVQAGALVSSTFPIRSDTLCLKNTAT